MATIPVSTNNVTLMSGVPLNKNYEHTRWFTSKTSQNAYFGGMNVVKSYNDVSYQREDNVMYFKADVNIERLRSVDYLTFINNDYKGKKFYCFVTKLEYMNAKATKVHFEVDVLQTFMFDYKFNHSFVNREHSDQYNKTTKLPLKNTIDEGLAYGSVMELRKQKQLLTNDLGYSWLIIVSKERIHSGDTGLQPTDLGVPQPLCYYTVPIHRNRGSKVVVHDELFNGKYGKTLNPSLPKEVLHAVFKNAKNVNEIVSIYMTDYFGLPFKSSKKSDLIDEIFITDARGNHNIEIAPLGEDDNGDKINALWLADIKEFKPMVRVASTNLFSEFFENRPQNSKLYSAPYCKIIMTTFRGQQIELNPEEFTSKNIDVIIRGSLGTSNKVSYAVAPYGYNPTKNSDYLIESTLDSAVIDSNPNDVPILVDTLASYIQGNKNSILNQTKSIMFGATMGATRSVSGATGGLATRNAGQTVDSVLGGVESMGNAQLKLEGLMAKAKDLDNTPPSIQQAGGNISYDLGNGIQGVYFQFKSVTYEYRMILTNYFNMYGYKTMRLKYPKTHTRKYWNYVQLETCNITSSIPQDYESKIKAIFMKGITLWHTNKLQDYSPTNEVL